MKMNTTKIDSNLEKFLNLTGSTWLSETIYLYTVAPFGLTGIILNALNLVVLIKMPNAKHISIPLLNYMKVYSINSILLSIMIFLFIFTHLPRYFQYSISYVARFYRCIIMINVANMLNFYESALYILIMLERISSFVLKFRKYTNIPCYKTSFLCLAFCCLICLPTYFMSYVKNDYEFNYELDNNNQIIYRYCEKTEFGNSIYGKIIISIVILTMNGLTLIIEITLIILILNSINHDAIIHVTNHNINNSNARLNKSNPNLIKFQFNFRCLHQFQIYSFYFIIF